MRILNRKTNRFAKRVQILFTLEEAEELKTNLDKLLTPGWNKDHFEITDAEGKHRLVVVVPEHNSLEQLQSLGEWVTFGPIYPKDVTQPER